MKLKRRIYTFLMALLMIISVIYIPAQEGPSEVQAASGTTVSGTFKYSEAYSVLDLVNSYRSQNGLGALSFDAELMEAAAIRAAEIKEVFDHTRPNGESCFTICDDMEWYALGENIAAGYSSASSVMTGWMNSSGHRANILSSNFNSIGIGCFVSGGRYYWVQIFAYKNVKSYTLQNDTEATVYVSTDASSTDSYIVSTSTGTGSGSGSGGNTSAQDTNLGVQYTTHVQNYGWLNYVSNGASSGTNGESKRLEAIRISLTGTSGKDIGVRYKTHVQRDGWQGWVYNGALSGTSGQSKRLEAICIELTGADSSNYDVYYRVHVQNYGWLGWAKNGEPAGTAGQSKRLEAIQIKVVPKGTGSGGLETYSFIDYGLSPTVSAGNGLVKYTTHVQTYGWEAYVEDGSISGTFNQSKRLEAIKIELETANLGVSGGIRYTTHVQRDGWQNWAYDGALSGTSGQSKRLEAIRIELTGDAANYYDVYYRVHAQTYGWLGWAKNGENAGTSGQSKRLEAIQIVIVPKGSGAPSSSSQSAYYAQ